MYTFSLLLLLLLVHTSDRQTGSCPHPIKAHNLAYVHMRKSHFICMRTYTHTHTHIHTHTYSHMRNCAILLIYYLDCLSCIDQLNLHTYIHTHTHIYTFSHNRNAFPFCVLLLITLDIESLACVHLLYCCWPAVRA